MSGTATQRAAAGPTGTQPDIAKLGLVSVILLGINSIVGAGIFLTPGAVIRIAGPLAPAAYLLAGVFAGVLAMVFATAARYVNTNGASYAYTTAAFGPRVGIYVGVTHAIAASIAWGVLSSFFVSTLLLAVFPGEPWADDTGVVSVKTLGFLLFIGVLLLINMFGNRVIAWANGISTVGKVSALALFIVGGLWVIVTQHVNHYRSSGASDVYHPQSYSLFGAVELGHSTVTTLILAVIAALYAFTGFESIANAAEEMKDPERNLPRAIPLAITAVAVVYTLAIVVGMALGSDKIAHSHQIVKLAAAIGNDVFRTIIIVGALVSMFGITLVGSFGAPRLWTALSDEGILPSWLSVKNRFGVPTVAFLLTASLAIAFPLALRFDDSHLTGLAVIARFVQFVTVPLALMALASNRSERFSHVRRNAVTDRALPILALLITVLLTVSFDYRTILLDSDGSLNYFSITLLVVAFAIVPAVAYWHHHHIINRKPVAGSGSENAE